MAHNLPGGRRATTSSIISSTVVTKALDWVKDPTGYTRECIGFEEVDQSSSCIGTTPTIFSSSLLLDVNNVEGSMYTKADCHDEYAKGLGRHPKGDKANTVRHKEALG